MRATGATGRYDLAHANVVWLSGPLMAQFVKEISRFRGTHFRRWMVPEVGLVQSDKLSVTVRDTCHRVDATTEVLKVLRSLLTKRGPSWPAKPQIWGLDAELVWAITHSWAGLAIRL
jgi:hypothetical protein